MAREDDVGGTEERSGRQLVALWERGQDVLAERDDLVEKFNVWWISAWPGRRIDRVTTTARLTLVGVVKFGPLAKGR